MAAEVRHHPRPARKPKADSPKNNEFVILGDLVMSCFWVFLSSTFMEVAETLSDLSGLQEFALVLVVTCIAIIAVGPVCNYFGGALFNPAHNAAFIVSGKGSVTVNIARMVAQIVGALAGSYAAVHTLPPWLQDHFHKLPAGLKEGVDLQLGFGIEAGFSALLNIIVLYSIDTKNKMFAYWAPIVATVILLVAGSYFTGPSLNPAIAFSWYHHYQGLALWQHVLLYWMAPFLGAMAGAAIYRISAELDGPRKRRKGGKKA